MIGNLIRLQFGALNNWPMGAAISIMLMLWIAAAGLAFRLLARTLRGRAA